MSNWIDVQRIAELRARVDYLESVVASQQADLAAAREERVRLQRMIDAATRRTFDGSDRRYAGLSEVQREVLADIAAGHNTIADLETWLPMERSALSALLRRLERRGLIEDRGVAWVLT